MPLEFAGIPFEASVADAPSVDQAVQVLSKELKLLLSGQYLTLQREILSCQDDADSCPNVSYLQYSIFCRTIGINFPIRNHNF